ncbi:VOC family protein [Methyloterricola oryzae]|uniref:VOC family protein n=1 Tax=Methyloterricola oryzae TaxID=1495050 RepID=UPI0005EB3B7B|nr:VOC family protein [Methyloterricola oryzae]
MKGTPIRIARATDNLEAMVRFYRDGLDLEVLGGFEDHEGFDGVMLGHPDEQIHFEFTHQRGHTLGRAPNLDDLIVFYLPDSEAWKAAIDRMRSQGHEPVASYNPYWDRRGVTFKDPDGYRVVLQNASWP